MSHYGSWSVKGVDDRARAVAKEKARLKGVTLGDYINNLLLDGHSEAGPRDLYGSPYPAYPPHHAPAGHQSALDTLAQRIEAVEARSTLAITGIDQSVLGMLARLEGSENSSAAMAAEVEAMVDDLRETHEALQLKVGSLEADDTAHKSLEAMKALEDALGKLASHVYEESRLSQDETSAVKGRVEAGFNELTDRVEGIEIKVESTLSDAAQRVEKAVEQAELRAEGTSRHLSERFSAIESAVTSKLAKVEDVDRRVNAIEGDVSGALTSMESTLTRIQDRLNRAEMTTDTALKALEQTFANLDERIDHVAELASPERADALRQQFEERFDTLAADLRASVEQSRQQLANEIERAAAGANPELMGELATRVSALETQDPTAMIDGLGDQISSLSDTLDERIVESERRSAAAIEQVGDQVASAIKHVQARQEQGQKALEEKVEAVEQRQTARLSDALANVSDRLAEMQTQTNTAVSPVQKAIISLASRLEALEDFNAPPLAEPRDEPLPDMNELAADDAAADEDPVPTPDSIPEPEAFAPSEAELQAEPETQAEATPDFENYDFIQALPDFDADDVHVVGEEIGPQVGAHADPVEDLWDTEETVEHDPVEVEAEDPFGAYLEDEAEHPADPLSELGSWDDSQHETRDSDIFSEDALADLVDDTASQDTESDEALAHNLEPELTAEDDVADETSDEESLLEPDEDATNYLNRAREAAIAAASPEHGLGAVQRGRRSNISVTPRTSGGSKVPLIAAASVFAIAAAGAGGWVALRGKTDAAGTANPTVAETSGEALQTAETDPVVEPTLTGIEFAEAATPSIEETLFDAEGSVAGAPEPEAEIAAPVEVALDLPEIPKALTLDRAAIEGDPIAQLKWGEARLSAQDFAAGADFVRRAARQGLPAAQYRLAKLHERGIGVPRDFFEARSWTEKAAQGGNTKAMHDLAVFYADGEGGAQSYAAAAEWFRKAADFGIVDSQYNLAVLYENGLGISPSKAEALYWYEVASANGDASAPGNVATLRESLPLEQAQQAQRRAAAWRAANPDLAANGTFGEQNWDRSTRAQVVAVQTVLNGLGYEAGAPDGIAGAGTREAVRTYQSANGLVANGVIDEVLVDTLNRHSQGLAG